MRTSTFCRLCWISSHAVFRKRQQLEIAKGSSDTVKWLDLKWLSGRQRSEELICVPNSRNLTAMSPDYVTALRSSCRSRSGNQIRSMAH